jgi:hypothetical protein
LTHRTVKAAGARIERSAAGGSQAPWRNSHSNWTFPMSDSADDIIQRMHAVRREVGNDVKGIVDTAKTLRDWR